MANYNGQRYGYLYGLLDDDDTVMFLGTSLFPHQYLKRHLKGNGGSNAVTKFLRSKGPNLLIPDEEPYVAWDEQREPIFPQIKGYYTIKWKVLGSATYDNPFPSGFYSSWLTQLQEQGQCTLNRKKGRRVGLSFFAERLEKAITTDDKIELLENELKRLYAVRDGVRAKLTKYPPKKRKASK